MVKLGDLIKFNDTDEMVIFEIVLKLISMQLIRDDKKLHIITQLHFVQCKYRCKNECFRYQCEYLIITISSCVLCSTFN